MTTLFDPLQFGSLSSANRVVMAPLTRDRAGPDRVPMPINATYYEQRAGAGLIVSEATQISAEGQGYLDTPGIYSDAQIAGWKRVTDAVHAKGGKIALQLWHVGRISHTSLQPNGQPPVSSTATRANGKTFTAQGMEDVSAPRALRLDEMPRLVADFRRAARNAMTAGFDGVEVHAANGYLLEQFMRDSINDRTDAYGGSQDNRLRLTVEVMNAIVDEIGAGKVGIRLSPITPVNDAGLDSDSQGLYNLLVEKLAPLRLAFIHVVEGATGGDRNNAPFDFAALRERFKQNNPTSAWIVNNGYDRAMALEAVSSGAADMVAFGKPFIANPDLVERLRIDAPLNTPVKETFYGGGAEGYIDYPTLEETQATA